MSLTYGEVGIISTLFESGLDMSCFDQQKAGEVISWDQMEEKEKMGMY